MKGLQPEELSTEAGVAGDSEALAADRYPDQADQNRRVVDTPRQEAGVPAS